MDLSPPLASHLAIPVHSSQEPFAGENMAYVSPAHQAVLDEMDRIEKAVAGKVSVLEILSPGSSSRNIKDVKKGYLRQAQRLHPHRGGNFSKERAGSAFGIVARAWEQVKRAAEFTTSATCSRT